MMTELQRQKSNSVAIDVIEGIKGDNYEYHTLAFTRWLRSNDRALTKQAVCDYFEDLAGAQCSANTIRVRRQAVKKRLRQLADIGGLSDTEWTDLEAFLQRVDRESSTRAPKIQQQGVHSGQVVTPEEYERVLAACRGAKQYESVRFLWATGCRVSELIGIHRRDCKVMESAVEIRIVGKGRKERRGRVPRSLYEEIRDVFRGEEYLFETSNGRPYNRSYISNQVAKLTKRAIGRPLRSHSMRHSWATRQIKAGRSLTAVSKYLGHSNVSITAAFYCHDDLTDAELFDGVI